MRRFEFATAAGLTCKCGNPAPIRVQGGTVQAGVDLALCVPCARYLREGMETAVGAVTNQAILGVKIDWSALNTAVAQTTGEEKPPKSGGNGEDDE